MRISKLFPFAAAFVLLAGLSLGTMAQGTMDPTGSVFRLPPPEPITPMVQVNAIEITDGTIGSDNQTKNETIFGYSFLGQTTGFFPGSFTLSMNCTPAIPMPGDTSRLTGGAWTLPVYMTPINGGDYAGSLYGTISDGIMNWGKTGNADVNIVLSVNGGTMFWDGVAG